MQVAEEAKHKDSSHYHADAPAAKQSPIEAKAYDIKGNSNVQSAESKEDFAGSLKEKNNAENNDATSKSSKEAQVSSTSYLKFFTIDDIFMRSSNIYRDKVPVDVDDSAISKLNVSPRGVGDYSIEYIINTQQDTRGDQVDEVDDLNLVIDLSSQINFENVESKPKK